MRKRRYQVSGIDGLGDAHTFGTDDRERAEDIVAIMREDLESVELTDTEHVGAETVVEKAGLAAFDGERGPPEALAFWGQAVADCDVELARQTHEVKPE
jgi:hypothetical protein